jgi:putative endonuclease
MSIKKGHLAEDLAKTYLLENNFRIIERNFYSRFGEIDLIVVKDGVLHFVEVKSGVGFDPIYNMTKSKLSKIIKTSQVYMKKNKLDMPYSFDLILVRDEKIEFLENITL